MDLTNAISITLGFISILLGCVSIYIALNISAKATNIELKTNVKFVKDVIKDTENEEDGNLDNLDNSDIQTAVDLIQQSGRKHDASYYYLLALKDYKNEYYRDAEQNFIRAIDERNGKYPAALFYLGHTYLKQHKSKGDDFFNKAKECFEKAKALGHQNAKKRLELLDEK
jgi:tetratricopeptide (TPR) repeat protein